MTEPIDVGSSTSLPARLRTVLAGLVEEGAEGLTEGLTEAECLEVVSLLEATKGAAAALQARAITLLVEQRDADARAARERGEISRREESCRRAGVRAEVALARRCSPGQSDRHVGLAAALTTDLPETMAALSRGEISEWRATIVARETAILTPEDRAEVDRRLAADLIRLGDRALVRAAQRACVDLDQGSVVRRRSRAAASRGVSVRPAPDGMAYLSVLGPLVDVVGAYAALTTAEKSRFVVTGDPTTDPARADDRRGRGEWLADTALERLSGRAPGQAQPVEVALVMSEPALLPALAAHTGPGSEWSELPGWGAVPPAQAREHLLRLLDPSPGDSGSATGRERPGRAGVWLRRLWTTPEGNQLATTDATRRRFTGALRHLIELRDPTCRIPWCDAPTRQVDHILPVARGGSTDAVNAMGTCQRHNLVKEAPGWRAETVSTGLDPGGGPHEVLLRTPTGTEHRCPAPPLVGAGRPPPGRRSSLESHLAGLLAAA